MWSRLVITDGTKNGTVDLLPYYKEWLPSLAVSKGGGYWSSSTYTQGRQLFDKQFENIIDTFVLNLYTGKQIETIDLTNKLTTLLDKGVAYWINDFQTEMVWIEMRPKSQPNIQYAIISDWSIPNLDEVFVPPFSATGTMEDISLIIEHGIWLENQPGVGTQLELQSANSNVDANTDRKRTWLSNYQDFSPLTHIFVFDASGPTYTDITGLTGVGLLPAVPAVGDILYVIVQDAGTKSPFHNIVFNIGIAQAGLTIVPEYSRGAGAYGNISTYGWPYVDDTNSFQRTGPNAIVFDYPGGANSWQTDVVNGITGWIIRFRVSAGAGVSPTIVNDPIYTNENPYFDIPGDQVAGTYPAQMKYELWRRDTSTNYTNAYFEIGTKALVGLRSLERGADFVGFLPTYDPILPANIAYTMSIGAVIVSPNIPWYRNHRWVPGGALANAIPGYWTISDPLSRQYPGTYRVFLRVLDNCPAVGDIEVRLGFSAGNIANVYHVTEYQQVVTLADQVVLDFGLVTIPNAFEDPNYDYDLFVILESNTTAASTNIYFYDLILMPADECLIDLQVAATNNWQTFDQDEILLPDSITNPKFEISADMLRETIDAATMQFVLGWQARTPGENIANINQTLGQRVWTFLLYNQNYITGGEADYRAIWSTAVSARAWRNQRYKMLRG